RRTPRTATTATWSRATTSTGRPTSAAPSRSTPCPAAAAWTRTTAATARTRSADLARGPGRARARPPPVTDHGGRTASRDGQRTEELRQEGSVSRQPPAPPGPVPNGSQPDGSPPAPPPGPGGAVPPAPPRGRRTALVVVAVAVLAVVGVGAYLLLSGDDGGGPDSPEEAVTRMVEALAEGDCEALMDVVLVPDDFPGDRSMLVEECEANLLPELEEEDAVPAEVLSMEVEEEGEGRVTVVADFRTRSGEENTTSPIPVVRRDGRWLVDAT